ncbi:MAG: dihydroneopterin aldolase [Candidatus Lambdaproteobacteria bacterium RIFOXYD1_FULL_56_27]|uniref:7,8-dihydroneopterin aldolase n=1 Tax=Candidatus Lambdaproteobacteria bacterium RIFOXYD2_FULL_56_26 TaxID=1817773 RepID=A0A1F6H3R6_9PROT|nr:MAG: dihydroneopterin aldolase [Candidatus Lambdaproteobacteria bacterium RIFOXYC1_FULL_56_13]OGH05011.1 MAG: dihydroneopterin aldolase [Candidatus Lambdaproteobacteria bacterium RIFOXYD2_FULL_56_26]OGH09476.1 MAG: dihydroneopterin aldolase [Candidatus Lambdaproteobacteria bacterium RIFOXYD1_FULL_56_27]
MERYQIEVLGLKLFGHHGVLPEETKLGQEFGLDFWLEVETLDLGADDPAQVVNYAQVVALAQEVFATGPFLLLEALGQAILNRLGALPGLKAAKLRVTKPRPPILVPLDHVGIVLSKTY